VAALAGQLTGLRETERLALESAVSILERMLGRPSPVSRRG
jgi:hypothetical protein